MKKMKKMMKTYLKKKQLEEAEQEARKLYIDLEKQKQDEINKKLEKR